MRSRFVSALALTLAALFAGPAAAYVIYLKSGGQLTAREKPVVQGKYVVFYTPLGAMQRIPVAEFDEKKTAQMNAQGTGDAYILGDTPQDKAPAAAGAAAKPSLSEYIKVHKKSEIGEERKPVEIAREAKGGKAGLQDVASGPSLDPSVESSFLHTLESYGVKAPRVAAAPVGVRVQGVAETEDQVFAAIKGIAKALSDSRTTGRQPLTRADIYLSTSTGESAGHFEMSADDADALVSGRKSAASWFMANLVL